MSSIPHDWHTVTLRGESYDGQTMIVHTSQDALTFYEGAMPITYHRISDKPELHHEARIARLLDNAKGGAE